MRSRLSASDCIVPNAECDDAATTLGAAAATNSATTTGYKKSLAMSSVINLATAMDSATPRKRTNSAEMRRTATASAISALRKPTATPKSPKSPPHYPAMSSATANRSDSIIHRRPIAKTRIPHSVSNRRQLHFLSFLAVAALIPAMAAAARSTRAPLSTNTTSMKLSRTPLQLPSPPEDPPPLPGRVATANGTYANRPNANMTTGLVGVRIRLNEPVFAETARLFQSVFAYQVQTIQIANYQQCFPEGCFFLHSFRITGFQKPRAITLRPLQPNKLLLNIFAFDVDIVGSISGNLQILLNVPVSGQIIANARQISIAAAFDLQKDQQRIPYLRTENCLLRSGYVNAQVSGMGLITDSVNVKYKKEMIDKARDIISMTICQNIEKTIKDQVNLRFKDMPKHISVYELFQYLDHTATDIQPRPTAMARDATPMRHFQPYRTQQQRYPFGSRRKRANSHGVATVIEIMADDIKRQSESRFGDRTAAKHRSRHDVDANDVIDEVEPAEPTDSNQTAATERTIGEKRPSPPKAPRKLPVDGAAGRGAASSTLPPVNPQNPLKALAGPGYKVLTPQEADGLNAFLDTIDMNSLARLFVSLDFLDSISDEDSFTIGMDGTVLLNASPYTGSYGDPPNVTDAAKLHFPQSVARKSMEIVMGEFTPNSMLQQAHRARILRFHIKNNTPLFGKMLKTSCTADEVCISDSIPEIGEKYPNKLLDIVVESVRPPRLLIGEDEFRIMMVGVATFYLTEQRQAVGKIPFSTIVRVGVVETEQVLHVNFSIPVLEILDDVDFFELPPDTLAGFRDAVKGAVENMARRVLATGLDLGIVGKRLAKYGIADLRVQLLAEGLLLMQADVDVYKLLFEDETLDQMMSGQMAPNAAVPMVGPMAPLMG